MRAHYLQHVLFEGLGSIETWLQNAGYVITGTRFYQSAVLPAVGEIDLLIVLGGPMSVNDEKEYSWLAEEKRFIRAVIEAGIPVLGICLGAQLIADAMGGKVYQNHVREIGWFPVMAVPPPDNTVFAFPAETEVFHWHGETFTLPPGAILLACSKGCENQAFQLGKSVIALQFHLETTRQSARDIISHCRDELIPAQYIQTEDQILSAAADRYEAINLLMADVLSFLRNSIRV